MFTTFLMFATVVTFAAAVTFITVVMLTTIIMCASVIVFATVSPYITSMCLRGIVIFKEAIHIVLGPRLFTRCSNPTPLRGRFSVSPGASLNQSSSDGKTVDE